MNPYEELGLQPDASDDTVRNAFKRLAQQHHPDKGGDTSKFERINASYRTLRDPEKRKRYDEFGVMDNVSNHEGKEAFIRSQAAEVLLAVIDRSQSVESFDLIARVREFLKQKIMELDKAMNVEIPATLKKRREARNRITTQKGDEAGDPVLLCIDFEIEKLERGRQQLGAKIANLQEVRQFFDTYGYVYEDVRRGFWITGSV